MKVDGSTADPRAWARHSLAGDGNAEKQPQSLYVATLNRANNRDVAYDFEGTGLGWRTDMQVEAKDIALPTTCKMERP